LAPRDTAVLRPSARARPPRAARPGPSTGGRTRQKNEGLILEAAEAVFAETGFNGASMQAIARRAGLPKANIHYYFGTKEGLYVSLLNRILDEWVEGSLGHIRAGADPAAALAAYVAEKIDWSRRRPLASKVFANEVIHGARQIMPYLTGKLRQTVADKVAVIDGWAAAGRIAPVDGLHLILSLWAMTQTYADFEAQIGAVTGKDSLDRADFDRATAHVTAMALAVCGLAPSGGSR